MTKKLDANILKQAVGEEEFDQLMKRYDSSKYPVEHLGNFTVDELRDYLAVVKETMSIRDFGRKHGLTRKLATGAENTSPNVYRKLARLGLYFHRHILKLKETHD